MKPPASIARPDPGAADWDSELAFLAQRRDAVMQRVPRPDDGADLFEIMRESATVCAIAGRDDATVAATMALGAAAGAAGAMAQAARGGFVLLRVKADGPPRRIPAGFGAMTPLRWWEALAMALIVRDRAAAAALLDPARIAACQMPADRAAPYWPAWCGALAAVVTGDPDAAGHVDNALAAMATAAATDGIATADLEDVLVRAMLALGRSLTQGGAGWDDVVTRALTDHRDWYAQDERHRRDRRGFLALGVTGLAALAHDRGIATLVHSPYMPDALIRGAVPCIHAGVASAASAATTPVPGAAADRIRALGYAESLKELLRPVLLALKGADRPFALAALRPRPGDATKVFTGALAAAAEEAYALQWATPPRLPPIDAARSELHIHLSPAGMFAEQTVLSRAFPEGYRALARWLDPHRIWGAWDYARPDEREGFALDGLVWCDDHWSWFPRPYVLLRPVIDGLPAADR